MKFAIGGFATTVFALLAIATAPYAAASPDNDFLDALANSGISYPPHATLGVINGGHTVCQRFTKGASYDDAIAFAVRGLGGNRNLAGTFVQAAVSSLCPKYASELP